MSTMQPVGADKLRIVCQILGQFLRRTDIKGDESGAMEDCFKFIDSLADGRLQVFTLVEEEVPPAGDPLGDSLKGMVRSIDGGGERGEDS